MDLPTSDVTAEEADELFRLAGQLIHDGVDHASFLRTFRAVAPVIAPTLFARGASESEAMARAAGAFAFALWRAMPSPHHGWRPASVPLPGRNEPCYCGSGQKFKRCCAGIAPPMQLLQEVNLLRFVLDACKAKELGALDVHRLDPIALGDVAAQWVDEGEAKRAAGLLEPLFRAPERLDARHVDAFDALMTAWLVLDRPRKRKDLVAALIRHPDAELANAARQREVSMLADQGEWEDSWSKFRDLLRRTPDDPALAHLEISLLKGQERDDEAVARAEFWSARLRQLDPRLADYADALLAMTSDESDLSPGGAAPPFVLMCDRLLQEAPAAIGAYSAELEDGVFEIRSPPELERIENTWRREFPVPEPVLTSLSSDPEPVIDRIPAAIAFLEKQPLAWQSFRILDDLARVAFAMSMREPFAHPWVVLQRKVSERAERLLVSILPEPLQPPEHAEDDIAAARAETRESPEAPDLELPWAVEANRPALRLIALQIDARQQLRLSDPRIDLLMAWLLRLNPDDRHGYRSMLAQRWLRASRPADALALLERYPDDGRSSLPDRILALYLHDRMDDAAALLESGGPWITEVVGALLAPNYRRPKEVDEEFITLGGRAEAWLYRDAMRPIWERSGALRWLKEHRPGAGAGEGSRKRGGTRAKERMHRGARRSLDAGADASGSSDSTDSSDPTDSKAASEAGRKRFAEIGGDPVRAHGALVATALAPDMGSPTGWVGTLLRPPEGGGPTFRSSGDAQVVLKGITAWYNDIVMEVGPASFPGPRLGEHATPWLDERTPDAVSRWVSGFMDSVSAEPAAWVKLGPYPELLAPLRKLAAQAPLSPTERGDPSLIRNRSDDAPSLSAVGDADPVALLVAALERLVQRVGLLREAEG